MFICFLVFGALASIHISKLNGFKEKRRRKKKSRSFDFICHAIIVIITFKLKRVFLQTIARMGPKHGHVTNVIDANIAHQDVDNHFLLLLRFVSFLTYITIMKTPKRDIFFLPYYFVTYNVPYAIHTYLRRSLLLCGIRWYLFFPFAIYGKNKKNSNNKQINVSIEKETDLPKNGKEPFYYLLLFELEWFIALGDTIGRE